MKSIRGFLILSVLVLASVSSLAGERARRVALVVGVAHYQHAGALENPGNDARAMEALLMGLGFDVEIAIDPTRADLEEAIRRFGRRSVGAEVSVFHYSGHALETGGRNWLLPVTFNVAAEREMPFEAVDLATVLDQAAESARVMLVFLDACRDNPFAPRLASSHRGVSSGGLAEIATPASGALIAFATSPGQVAADGAGANSPFTTALLHRLGTPGVEIKTVMGRVIEDVAKATDDRQKPWMTFTLKGDFYLNPQAEPGAGPAAETSRAEATETPEQLFWRSVMSSRNPSDFVQYLEKFPSGVFAGLARKRVAELADQALGAAAIDRDALVAQFVAHHKSWPDSVRDATYYLGRPDHRAIAATENYTFMRTARSSPGQARQSALEGCEIRSHKPCALLAENGSWAPASERNAPRVMPRAVYDGLFDPAMIPMIEDAARKREDVKSYRAAAGAKAAALLPSEGAFYVARGGTQRQAEDSALAQCNRDPSHNETSGTCLLYAAGDQVVLPKGSRTPLTPP